MKRPCTVCPPALHCFGGDWGIVLSSSLCSRNNIRGSYLLYLFLKLNDIEVDGFGFVRPNLEWGLSRLLRSSARFPFHARSPNRASNILLRRRSLVGLARRSDFIIPPPITQLHRKTEEDDEIRKRLKKFNYNDVYLGNPPGKPNIYLP